MKIEKTPIQGCIVIQPEIFFDSRGYFYESFNLSKFQSLLGVEVNFVQDNHSYSTKGVLRGLHFQTGEHAQSKLISVVQGHILDVVVDIRKDSKTFGKTYTIELSYENKKQLFMPQGIAHGFVVLSDEAIIQYKCDNYYNKESEGGILYNDKKLNINWRFSESDLIISDKDLKLPTLGDLLK